MNNDDDDDDNYPGKLLHQAALYLNADLLKDLLSGDEINNIDAIDRFGCTPLHTACLSAAQATLVNDTKMLDSSLEFIMILIDHGADLNIQSGERYDYKTPLHLIAEVGNEKILALLLCHKADLTIRDKHNYTPLLLAQINRKIDSVEMIQNEMELRQQVREDIEKRLLDACFDGDVAKAEECLHHLGAQVKAVLNSSPNGSDTLNFLYRACRTGNIDLVKLLLKHGAIAKPHRQTSYSPLYIACRLGYLEIVEMLLTHFPHLICVATLEQILPFAAACSQGHLEIVKLLLTYSNYPFSICNLYVDRLQRSYVFPFNLNAQDLNDQTSLYLAVLGGHTNVVEYLLSFHVPTLTSQEIEQFKRRSTHNYSFSDPITTLSAFNSTLQNLNSTFCPFNVDIYSNTGRTALHEAIEQQHMNIIHLLISHGANVNLPYEEISSRINNEQQCFITRSTPLSCACRFGNVQLIEYLLNSLATDKEFLAFNSCKQSYLIGHLLKYRALQDNEFKLNKRQFLSNIFYTFDEEFWSKVDLTKIWMNANDEKRDDNNNTISESNYSVEPMLKRRTSKRYQILSTGFEQLKNRFTTRPLSTATHALTSSSCIPTTPVGIQWHHYGPLKTLDPLWFIQASTFVNKDTFTKFSDLTPSNRHLLFHCITRIDLSDNSLENLPAFLFQMYSLRILNVSNNQLGELPNDNQVWLCHQLIELDVSHNALTSLPSAMFQLRSLQRAYAAHNQLQYLPVEMWAAPMLTDLNVANNSLKELPAPSIVSIKPPEKLGRHMTSRHSANQNRTASEFRPQMPLTPPSKLNLNETKSPTISSSVTTSDLSILTPPLSAPPRSTTFAQISTNNMPPSPDDDEELERRSKLKITYDNSNPAPPTSIPVKRLCLWQNYIAENPDEDQPPGSNTKSSSSSTSTFSRLNNLNLSHNRFEILPPMLCCLAPYLTSLNISHNLLSDSSNISSYPSRLKTLDLSYNRLQTSILSETTRTTPRREKMYRKNRQTETITPENICYRPELKDNNAQTDVNKRRRSRSVSRHKALASTSLTLGINSSGKSDQCDQSCPHRRHTKLEFLTDLNLSDNIIHELILLSIFKSPADIDSTVLRSALLFPAITRLNLSQNELESIPSSISLLDNLGTLILRDNAHLKEIPLSIGSMQKLWNLDLHGCGRSSGK